MAAAEPNTIVQRAKCAPKEEEEEEDSDVFDHVIVIVRIDEHTYHRRYVNTDDGIAVFHVYGMIEDAEAVMFADMRTILKSLLSCDSEFHLTKMQKEVEHLLHDRPIVSVMTDTQNPPSEEVFTEVINIVAASTCGGACCCNLGRYEWHMFRHDIKKMYMRTSTVSHAT